MFKNATQLPTYRKYLVVLNKSLKRLKKIQTATNQSGGGSQSSNMMLSVRFIPALHFDDKGDKKPHPILLVGTKSIVKKITDDLVEKDKTRKNKAKSDKPVKPGARGFVFWHETDKTFHVLAKGPMKLPALKGLFLRAGHKDKIVLGEASEDLESKAADAEKLAEELNRQFGEDEPDEELPEIGDDEDEDEEDEGEGEEEETQVHPTESSTAKTETPPPTGAQAEFADRLKELAPQIKQAIDAKGPRAGELAQALETARTLGQNSQFEAGLRELERAATLLIPEAPKGPPTDGDGDFKGHFRRIGDRIKQLTPLDPGPMKAFGLEVAATWKTFTGGDATGALSALRDIETRVERAAEAFGINADLQAAAANIDKNRRTDGSNTVVNLQASRLVWDQSYKRLQAQLAAAVSGVVARCRELNEDEEAEEEFDMGEVETKANTIYEKMGKIDDRLIDAMDKALNASGDERTKLQSAAKDIVKEYRDFIGSDPFLTALDASGFPKAKIKDSLDNVLKTLAGSL